MSTPVQYSTSTPLSGSLRKGNVIVGINDLNYGPTSTTGWYNSPDISPGTYQVIQVSSSGDPEVFCPQSDAELINFVKWKGATGSNTGSAVEALAWIGTQTGLMAVNNTFPNIVTNGMIFNWDAKMASSYPGTGSVFYTNAFSGSNPANLYNNPSYKKEGWIDFDGTDDYFSINQYSPTYPGRLGFTNSFTFCFVIKFPSMGSGAFDPILLGFDSVTGAQFNFYRNNGWPTNYMGFLAYSTSGYINEWAYYEPGRFYQIAVSLAADGTYLALHNNTTNKSGQFANFSRWYVNQNEIAGPGRGLAGGAYSFGSLRLYNRGLTRAEMLQNLYLGPIVTDGLVFNVDAGNLPSYYSGSSTAWSITGSSSGSLVNGTGYSNNNLGSWVLDGIDDYIPIPNNTNIPTGNSQYTISVWFNFSGASFVGAYGGLVGWGNYGVTNGVNALRLNGNGFRHYWWGNDLDVINLGMSINTWYNVVALFNGTNRQIWLNGIKKAEDTPVGHNVITTSNLAVGVTNNVSEFFNGKISNALIYNKGLSESEIIQNFNAHKGRFGL